MYVNVSIDLSCQIVTEREESISGNSGPAQESNRPDVVKIFEKLRRLRGFQKRYLPQLEALEDFDIVRGIGYYQDLGTPLTLKVLFLEDIGSAATVQRRLRRLARLGVVHQKRSKHDRRNFELKINPEIRKTYRRKGWLLRSG